MRRATAICTVIVLLGTAGIGAVQVGAQTQAQGWVYQDRIGHSGIRLIDDVAVDGDVAVAGGGGKAFIYTRQATGWMQAAELQPPGSTGFGFGSSVAVDGDRIVVGDTDADEDDDGDETGAAFVFEKDADGNWVKTAVLYPSEAVGSKAGDSVAVAGDTILVGDPWGERFGEGRAYVYVQNDAGAWVQQATLAPHEDTDGRFGFSVGLSGDTALVGDWERNKASIFVRESDTWSLQAELAAQGASQLAWSVALDGGRALLGDPATNSAYVFAVDDTGSWSRQATLEPSCGPYFAESAKFGATVALDGETAIVGDPKETLVPIVFHPGAAYAFSRDGSGSWSSCQHLTPADATDRFGHTVAVSDGTAFVTDPSPRGVPFALDRDASTHVFANLAEDV